MASAAELIGAARLAPELVVGRVPIVHPYKTGAATAPTRCASNWNGTVDAAAAVIAMVTAAAEKIALAAAAVNPGVVLAYSNG